MCKVIKNISAILTFMFWFLYSIKVPIPFLISQSSAESDNAVNVILLLTTKTNRSPDYKDKTLKKS